MPAISIILPFHSAAATLPTCLASISRQSMADFELLAIDDGSTDESAALLRALAARDARVHLLEPGRVGLVAALNLGIGHARAPLLARMDADDLMHPQRLALQLAYLEANPHVALVASRAALFPKKLVRAGYQEYLRWQNACLTPAQVAAQIYIESPFAHPSVTLRRSALAAAGGPYAQGPFPEDYELWLRIHQAGMPMAKLPRTLLAWREGDGRASRSDPRYSRAAFDALRARFLADDPRLRQGRDLVYWGAGRATRLRAKHLIVRGFPPSAWVDIDPDKVGHTVWGAPVRPITWLDRSPRPFVLIYLTAHGARAYAEGRLAEWGYRPGEDYLAVG
ncbi:glycosyltransferase [Chloroflexales bacterium ZM16-3]|nr:glycosyltransferase [Chloroflexales bacterium ZM16-3]